MSQYQDTFFIRTKDQKKEEKRYILTAMVLSRTIQNEDNRHGEQGQSRCQEVSVGTAKLRDWLCSLPAAGLYQTMAELQWCHSLLMLHFCWWMLGQQRLSLLSTRSAWSVVTVSAVPWPLLARSAASAMRLEDSFVGLRDSKVVCCILRSTTQV